MFVVVMGVSGCGKTTVATSLAVELGWLFQEGDELHPPGNIEKMRAGTPLTDWDRLPWLEKIARHIDGWRAEGQSGVLTCSALKRSYREVVVGDRGDVALTYLRGSRQLIGRRLAARQAHFMPTTLLDSQYAILEEPAPEEQAIVVDVEAEPAAIVAAIVREIERRIASQQWRSP